MVRRDQYGTGSEARQERSSSFRRGRARGCRAGVAARTELGVGGSYSANLPALTAGVWTNVTRHLATEDIAEPTFKDVATKELVRLDSKVIDANTVAVRADVAVAANALRITVTS